LKTLKEIAEEVSPKEIYEKVKQWRIDSTQNFNDNFAGKSSFNQYILIGRVDSLEQDVKYLLSCVELLAAALTKDSASITNKP